MERLIECDICLQYFNDLRKPRVLKCGHSFCTQCLRRTMKHGIVYCAICRAEMYSVTVTQIPRNYTLESLVPLVKKNLGIECNSKDTENMLGLRKKIIEKEVRKNLEEEFKEKMRDETEKMEEEFKEKMRDETEKMSRKLKIKIEKESNEKMHRLQKSNTLLRGELHTLKGQRMKDKTEMNRVIYENKMLRQQKKPVARPRYMTRSSISRNEVNPGDAANLGDETNPGAKTKRRSSLRNKTNT